VEHLKKKRGTVDCKKKHYVYIAVWGCGPDVWQRGMNDIINIMKPTWCTFHSIYWESRAYTCFDHYLLILRRLSTIAGSLQSWHSHLTLYACNIPNSVCVTPPEDE
jgi:hypothetical protein